MSEALKSRHAFGSAKNIDNALSQGLVDAYDILFLDGDTEPKIGWIDKNGVLRLVECKTQVVRVEELPTSNGSENVVYIYNNECYIWDGNACVSMSKSADLTALETQVSNIENQMNNKIDANTVQSMVDTAVESAVGEITSNEVIEF